VLAQADIRELAVVDIAPTCEVKSLAMECAGIALIRWVGIASECIAVTVPIRAMIISDEAREPT
jgi:hypothetical protein